MIWLSAKELKVFISNHECPGGRHRLERVVGHGVEHQSSAADAPPRGDGRRSWAERWRCRGAAAHTGRAARSRGVQSRRRAPHAAARVRRRRVPIAARGRRSLRPAADSSACAASARPPCPNGGGSAWPSNTICSISPVWPARRRRIRRGIPASSAHPRTFSSAHPRKLRASPQAPRIPARSAPRITFSSPILTNVSRRRLSPGWWQDVFGSPSAQHTSGSA